MLNILSIGYSHPTTLIDNQFLEALDIGTTAQWIMEKIGIETRRTTLPLDYIRETRNQDPREAKKVASMGPTEMGVEAAKMALDKAGVLPEQVTMVICNCCKPDQTCPSEAQRIADRLGIKGKVFDVFTACPAFALHLDFLASYKEEKLPEYVLCISTAALTQSVNYNDRTDGAIWGDGAAAYLVSAKHQGKLAMLDSFYATDPSRSQAVVVDTYGHFHQDGRAVRDFSVRQTVRLIKRMEESFDINWRRDIFVGHQANATMLEQITNNREIGPDNHWHNVRTYGNQAGAGAPIVIGQHWDRLVAGQKLVVAVVGAGLSWGSVLLEVRD